MNALLWKDFRLNRSILLLTAVLFVLPHLGGMLWLAFESAQRDAGWWSWQWSYDTVMRMGVLSLVLSLVGLTVLAGNALACEREEGSDEFLAVLPPTNGATLTSKILVVLGAMVLFWGLDFVAILGIAPRMPGAPIVLVAGVDDNPITELLMTTGVALSMLGAAWWIASFSRKASTAWALAFTIPIAIVGAVGLAQAVGVVQADGFGSAFLSSSLVLGIAGGVRGSLNYLRGPRF